MNKDCVVASMAVPLSLNGGKAACGTIVNTSPSKPKSAVGMLNPIRCGPDVLSAASIRHRQRRRSSEERKKRRRTQRRIHTAVIGAAGAVVAVLVLVNLVAWPPLPRDDDRVLTALARKGVPFKQYLAAATEATRRRPSDYMPHLSAAHQAVAAGDPQAITLLNRALFLFPGSPKIHVQAARALIKFGYRRQALGQYRLALEAGALPNPVLRAAVPYCVDVADLRALLPEDADIHARAIKWLRAVENFKLAHWVAEGAYQKWPHDMPVCMQRAEALLALGQKNALTAARACVEQEPRRDAYLTLAAASAKIGPKGSEITVYFEARKHFPDSVLLSENLARAHLTHGQYSKALEVAEEMLRPALRWQQTARAHQLLGKIHKAMGHAHSAQYHLEQAREIQAEHAVQRTK